MVIFSLFYWFTFNEPFTFCVVGMGLGAHAPNMRGHEYNCAHNQLLSHASVYHLYNDKYRSLSPKKSGQIGWTCIGEYGEPQNPENPEHVAAADRFVQFYLGWYMHPIFSETGDYPAVMREYVDARSPDGPGTRLPQFNQSEIEYIKGTADFIALQHYTSRVVVPGLPTNEDPYLPVVFLDAQVIALPDPVWPNADPIKR